MTFRTIRRRSRLKDAVACAFFMSTRATWAAVPSGAQLRSRLAVARQGTKRGLRSERSAVTTRTHC